MGSAHKPRRLYSGSSPDCAAMSIIDKKKRPMATGTLEQEIAEISLLLAEASIRLQALGLRLVCSIEEEKPQEDNK